MTVGCGSATEPTVKTEEARSGEILPEEETDTPSKDNDKDTAESQENTSGKWQVLEPDIAAAVDVDFLGKVWKMEEDTSFYMRSVDGENHEGKEAGFQDLKEYMSVEMKGSFVNDEFHATEIRFF